MQVMAFYHDMDASLQKDMVLLMDDALRRMRLRSITEVQHTDGAIIVSFLLHMITQESCSIKVDMP